MTRNRDFKALVRDRIKKTGERYTAARAQILAKGVIPSPAARTFSGVLPGYVRFGGIQSGTAAVANMLAFASLKSALPETARMESLINGLCGGPGFLYAVFEYKGWPPMLTLALRSRSMPDVYIAEGLKRIGMTKRSSETTSAVAARKALEAALDAGKPALCVTDAASLPWTRLPKEFIGGGPHVVAVAGRDGDDLWVDDRAAHPRRISTRQFSTARAAYRNARNRLVTFDGPEPRHDAKASLRDAIADTAKSYVEPAVPKSFWVNCGFSGLDKWRQLLVDPDDKRGWPALFSEGPRAWSGLQRLYESIECQSAPQAGRGLYADFLEDAAGVLGAPKLARAAAAYRESGALWASIGEVVTASKDSAIRTACEMANRRLEVDDAGSDSRSTAQDSWQDRQKIAAGCKLSRNAAAAMYAEIGSLVERIAEAERAAVALMV